MATGIGNLPYPMPPVSPFDTIKSQETNERIANIESLANGTGQGDGSITAVKTAFGGNYTTTEVNTGFTWVDGKTIYKKTVSVGPLPNATTKNVAHGITGIDNTIDLRGWGKETGTGQMITLPYVIGTGTGGIGFQLDLVILGANIRLRSAENLSSYATAFVTIHYTKV